MNKKSSEGGEEKGTQGLAHVLKLGKLKVLLYANSGTDGTWYSIILVRVYRDKSGAEKHATTLGRDDLLPAGHLLGKAYDWVCRQQKLFSEDKG